jgi:hypothetical protein
MLKPESFIKRHGFLLVAFGVMLLATLMLAVIQFFAVKRIEAEAQAALEANLDLQLYALVNEARRYEDCFILIRQKRQVAAQVKGLNL